MANRSSTLRKILDANAAGMIVERFATSDRDGEAVMYMLEDQLSYMMSVNDDHYPLHPEIVGPSTVAPSNIPLEMWVALKTMHGLKGSELIEIDLENHELAVMRSLYAHVAEHRPPILIEIIRDDNAASLSARLRPLDYIYNSIDEADRTVEVVASLWDNDHQNSLICRQELAGVLRSHGLF